MDIDADDPNAPTGVRDSEDQATEVDPVPRGRSSMTTRRLRGPNPVSTLPGGALAVEDLGPTIWWAGDRVDRYELIEQIGVGGMGVVWSARDVDLGRDVAIKLSFPTLHAELLEEARAMARLSHPNVVTVYDVGSTHDGLFIAMERMDGGTLGEWLRAAWRPWDEVVEMFIAAGRGLAAAHRAGLVHRDFKPDNVLVGRDGIARVSDFGLALPSSEVHERAEVAEEMIERAFTQEGAPIGTLAYMAPEQLLGQKITAQSDQFSFCLALHEALYGVSPFVLAWGEASTVAVMAAVVEGRVVLPPDDRQVPVRLYQLLLRGLAPDAGDRWPSMDALLAELERCLYPIV